MEEITLHVPRSEDGNGEFARIADILDVLATMYGWHPQAHDFLLGACSEARNLDLSGAEEKPT